MNEPQYEIVSFFPENFFNKDVNGPFKKKNNEFGFGCERMEKRRSKPV